MEFNAVVCPAGGQSLICLRQLPLPEAALPIRPRTLAGILAVSFLLPGHLATAGERAASVEHLPGVPPAYQGDFPSLAALNVRNASVEQVVTGLHRPWALEFIDAQTALVTELHGDLLVVDLRDGSRTRIDGLPPFATDHDQTGLLDVALHPGFAINRRIYFSYVEADPETGRYFTPVVATAVLAGERLEDLRVLLRVEPYGWSPANFGGALAFDHAGFLYVTIGDRSEDAIAQRGDRLEGKVLRLHDDGSVPVDNPFVGDEAVDDRIYALGLRNAQGLHYDPVSRRLFAAEHGPLGGDEVNVIEAGANYGWPVITYGRNYSTAPIGEGTHRQGMRQPLFYYLPSEAISPITQYRGTMFPEWEGDLLVGALKGQHVSKLDLDGAVVRSEYPLLGELNGRVRDVKVHADGSIYILLQTGTLHRLARSEAEAPPRAAGDPAEIYGLVCAGCHDTGAGNAPRPGDTERWREIRERPREEVYRRVIEGFGAMPERGLCNICTDAHLRATTDYMLGQSGAGS